MESQCNSIKIVVNLFDGIKQDSQNFLKQFKKLAIFKKLSQPEQVAIFSSYLKGAALSFYKSIEDSVKDFSDLEQKFLEDFPPVINYEEKFYYARQESEENILEYFYRLHELAAKAKIVDEEKYITQFLKSTQPFYKHKLATSIFESKKRTKYVEKSSKDFIPVGMKCQINCTKMVVGRKYIVTKYHQYEPKRSDYELVTEELPPLKDGEILVKAEWISVDPYLWLHNANLQLPYDQYGCQVGVVQESKDPKHPVGSRVFTHRGWCDYSVVNMSAPILDREDRRYALPDLQGLSPSLALGYVGMPGATGYISFFEIGKPKPGETVVVSGAAGAVGSLVGQLAKIKGCKVIGFAGSDQKVEWLVKKLGFDKAYNYKTVNIANALQEAAPEGVDIYFDNVGGEISSTVMYKMNSAGRVVIVGSISSYNSRPGDLPKVTILQPTILSKTLKVEGFIVWDWFERWHEVFEEIVKLIKSGKLKAPEHVTEGFDNLFDSFIGVLKGDNFGKAVVKV